MKALLAALPDLRRHRARMERVSLRALFAEDGKRFERFSASAGPMLLDYSKNRVDASAMGALVALAEAAGVAARRTAMLAGEAINTTERRAALHVALRAGPGASFAVDGKDVMPGVRADLLRMLAFAEAVRTGEAAGRGGRFTDVVNIGIGGSDLGPAMATRALRPYHTGPRVHFVANVDGAHLADTLAGLDPGRTLFLVASKTFTTIETLTNATTARRWIVAALGEAAVAAHFAAVSTAPDKMASFGLTPDRTFGFADWVGGRYSLWSSIGLPLAIAIGAERFQAFLAGGRAMDEHFVSAPFGANLPVILAMIGIWHRNVWGFPALAVLPYDQRLERLPAYLQQLDMESNGKGVGLDGAVVTQATAPIVFGEPGTNGQHAFYQLLHQGTETIPADFLLAASGHEGWPDHHDQLAAACFAQSEALMRGKTRAEVEMELSAARLPPAEMAMLAPHKVFSGDRPSNTILYPRLDPEALGRLVALYEHKVFVQGVVWGVNSFDQWGVELGKQLASRLAPAVRSGAPAHGQDSSTAGLIRAIARMRKGA